jgi:dTDP-4-dehydrorhamnose 3,5-epimerase-like enzyme
VVVAVKMIVVVDVVLVAELDVLDVKVKIRQRLPHQDVDLQIVVVGVKTTVVISVRMGVLHATRVALEDAVHVVMCVAHHVALDAQMGARLHLLYQKIITHVLVILAQVTVH